jgi:outer membrane protein TolC
MKNALVKGCCAVLLLLSTAAGAQQRHDFSAQQTVDYARKNSAQVKNALLGIQLQEQQNRELTASAYPQVTGNIATNYNPNVAVQQFPNFIAAATYGVLEKEGVQGSSGPIKSPNDFGYIQAQFGTKFNASFGASLQQLLFDGQVFVGLQARATSMEFARKNAEVTEETIRANIYKIYYQLAASKAQLQLIDANIERIRKLESDARAMYENGFAEKIEVNRASVQLSNLETERVKALNAIQNGFVGLKALMGMPVRDTLMLTDSVTYDMIKDGVLENLNYNYVDRKEYQLAQLGTRLREYNVKRYKMTYIPTIALSGSYNRLSQGNSFGFFSGTQWFPASAIGINVSVPIFDGFARDARIRQAKIQLQQSQNDLEGLKLNIDQEAETALNNYKSSLATLDAQKRNMELAETVFNQARLKREQRLGTTLEITTAQADLQVAQSNYILSMYDAIKAKIDFLKATGRLQ